MDADVIIIGSGGGGGVAAKELGEKGLKVLALDAGPWFGNSKWPEPNSDRGAISSNSYDDLSIELLRKEFTLLEDDMNDFVSGKFRWGPADREKPPWFRKIIQGGYIWQNAGVGGSTLHYYANCPRAYPQSINNIWPISYEELLPYYEKVEANLPVGTGAMTAKEELFLYCFKNAGYKPIMVRNVTEPGYRLQPNAILSPNLRINDPSFDFDNNESVGCTLKGHCVNGCATGPSVDSVAKRSTLVSYVPRALRSGNVEIRPNSFVTRVITEQGPNGLQAVGVKFRDTWTGETGELTAKVIVMSAGGIETPRLWMNSKLPENPWVGRGLLSHWFDSVSGIFEEGTLMNILGVSDIKPFVGQNAAARFDYPGYGVIEVYGTSPGLYASMAYGSSDQSFRGKKLSSEAVPWDYEGNIIGEQLKSFMREYNRTLSLLIFTDDEVRQSNSVTLDPYIKDENGYIPVINYQPSARDTAKRNMLAKIAADILRKAGARTVIRSNWSPGVFLHIMSTMRIGYVTDNNCEAKQVNRLYIADNSVLFNGLGGPNPTLTNQTMATRTADKIAEKYFS